MRSINDKYGLALFQQYFYTGIYYWVNNPLSISVFFIVNVINH